MIAKKTELEPAGGAFSVLESVVSKVERATDYIADAVIGSDDDNDDYENTTPDDEREPDDCSVASDVSNGSEGSKSVFTCGSATCGSVDDASIDTLTLADQQEYVIEKPAYVKTRVNKTFPTNRPKASTIGSITIIPFVVEDPGLLGIQIKGVTTNNIAYVADVPSTCNPSCKALRPGDVLAPYMYQRNFTTERPKPYTLAEFTYRLVSNKRPLRFVAIRSSS